MSIVIQDSCTDVDGTNFINHVPEIGGAWSLILPWDGHAEIGNNTLVRYGETTHVNAAIGLADCYMQAKLLSTSKEVGLQLRRVNGAPTFYEITLDGPNATILIKRHVNSNYFTLLTINQAPIAGNTYKIDVVGNLLTAYENGVSIGSVSNNVITDAGYFSIHLAGGGVGGTSFLDDIEAGNLSPPLPPTLNSANGGQRQVVLAWS